MSKRKKKNGQKKTKPTVIRTERKNSSASSKGKSGSSPLRMANRKKAVLRIRLCSDLCVGSGYSYGGVIDTDVCYNENGIPYIPGRRIKGCLREAAELIRLPDIEKMFGVRGNDRLQGIMIDNAYPEGFKELDKEISELKRSDSAESKMLKQQNVLGLYTRIKAQTKITPETGVAEKNMLRYTRVVNQYDPISKEPMNFLANIEFDCEKELVERAVKALRHIGMHRNRGLGNVECSIEAIEDIEDRKADIKKQEAEGNNQRLEYVLQNIQPLMLSERRSEVSESFISGQRILGMFAGMYLKQQGASAEDEFFQEIFLQGKVLFTNLTPALPRDTENDREYIRHEPVPCFVKRRKASKKLVNLAAKKGEGKEEEPLKGLKDKFIYFNADGKASVIEADKEVIYHHSRRDAELQREEEPPLYTQEAIQEGQYFAGSILAESKYMDMLEFLLENFPIRLGKSRSTQYGLCRCVKKERSEKRTSLSLEKGEKIWIALVSDAMFIDEGAYTVRYAAVRKCLADSLGLPYETETEEKDTYLQKKDVSGFHTLWNLQKPSVPAIGAGSVFAYTVAKDCEISKEFVGERNLEGFGQIHIYREKDMADQIEEYKPEVRAGKIEKTLPLLREIRKQFLMEQLKCRALEMDKIELNASQLGRIHLMLTESMNDNPGAKDAYRDFCEKISLISREKEKKLAEKFLEQCVGYPELDADVMLRKDGTEKERWEDGLEEKARDAEVESLWGDYLKYVLNYQRYLSKSEEVAK